MRRKFPITMTFIAVIVIVLLVGGCGTSKTPSPTPLPSPTPAPTGVVITPTSVLGTLTGTVTNSLTNAPISSVTISTDPVVQGISITTKDDGTYSANLPVGVYAITFTRSNFTSVSQNVSLVSGEIIRNVGLKPVSPVVIDLGKPLAAAPDASVSIKANVQPLDGSTVKSYAWTQVDGAKATLDDDASDTVKITLAAAADYKAQMVKDLAQLDRFQIQPINPHVLETAQTVIFKMTVITSSGTYSNTQTVSVNLPYAVSSGIADVPINVPVLLHGKNQASYKWSISGPSGSNARLDSTADQNPSFTPDVTGKYTITETTSGVEIDVYAGTWEGAITGQDANGKPVTANCSICHNGKIAPDPFSEWRNTGHAAIFTQNLNTSGHYSESCFSCHTVGFNKNASNGGFDDAPDYGPFFSSGMLNNANPSNWSNMLSRYPMAAQLANIQCENCHGPNNHTGLHGTGVIATQRVSLAADLCGACHGEPLRHGRFQQWEESAHANFQAAIDKSTSASCARCHTAQGFLAWTEQSDMTKPLQGENGDATADELKTMGISPDTVQPVTCATCHDPHDMGTTSGEPNDATVRIMGDTPLLPSGYQAVGVGRGAICITCHNTRNGAHNDNVGNPANYQAPHEAAQGDVLMGENAYFVTTSARSPHSYIQDTCAKCHMEKTLPPAEFSYEGSGTNHSFKASTDICASCHGQSIDASTVQDGTEAKLEALAAKLSSYLLGKMGDQMHVLDYTPHDYNGTSYDLKSNDLAIDKSNIASVAPTEPHGQQGYILTLNNPVSVTYAPQGETPHTLSLNQVQFQLGDITTDGKTKLIATSDPLVRAGWNYFLIDSDSSKGVHNPSFTMNVLQASLDALK